MKLTGALRGDSRRQASGTHGRTGQFKVKQKPNEERGESFVLLKWLIASVELSILSPVPQACPLQSQCSIMNIHVV